MTVVQVAPTDLDAFEASIGDSSRGVIRSARDISSHYPSRANAASQCVDMRVVGIGSPAEILRLSASVSCTPRKLTVQPQH